MIWFLLLFRQKHGEYGIDMLNMFNTEQCHAAFRVTDRSRKVHDPIRPLVYSFLMDFPHRSRCPVHLCYTDMLKHLYHSILMWLLQRQKDEFKHVVLFHDPKPSRSEAFWVNSSSTFSSAHQVRCIFMLTFVGLGVKGDSSIFVALSSC